MASTLKKNDPYNDLLESQKDDIKPGFLNGRGDEAPSGWSLNGGIEDGTKLNGERVGKKKSGRARQDFEDAENGAVQDETDNETEGGFYRGGNVVDGTRKQEESAGGFYSGKGKIDEKGRGQKKGLLKLAKRGGPLGVVIMILGMFGVGMGAFSGVSTELIAWKENAASMFGQNSAVMNRRSNYMIRRLLNNSGTKETIFGKTKFKVGSKLANKLKQQNIDYVELDDVGGKKMKLLVFEDADGSRIPIVADSGDLPRAKQLAGAEIDVDGVRVKLSDTPMTLFEAQSSNTRFRQSYDTATITFAGKIAGWFDGVADSMYKRIIGDNARNQTKVDDADQEKVDEMLLKNKSEGVDDSEMEVTKAETDEDGETVYRSAEAGDTFETVESDGTVTTRTYGEVEGDSGSVKTGNTNVDSVKSKLSAKAQKAAMVSATAGCAFLRGIGAISAAVGAVQTINTINYASKFLEMADRIKAGDADEAINLALNKINTPVETDVWDIDGNKVKVKGSVTESPGWNAPFASKTVIDENDPSALMVNRELANKNAIRGSIKNATIANALADIAAYGAGIAAFRVCNVLQATMGAIDAVGDIAAVFTFGIAKAVKEIIVGAIQGAGLALAMTAVTVVLTAITPTVANWFADKLTAAFLGLPGGYSLQSGSQNILNSNLQMSTGRYADKENAVEVFGLTNEVEEEWAFYERATKSPFDLTSKYTFFGSLYNSFLPIANMIKGSGIVSTMSSVASLTGDAALALVSPSVSAANETERYAVSISSEENCSYLSSVGVAGDFACNKYVGAYVGDLTTLDPNTAYEELEAAGSFSGEDSNGNPKIKADSDYARWIVACATSDTQPGTMSAAVQGFISKTTQTDNAVVNGLINFGMNFIPFEGFLDIGDSIEQEDLLKWNSGLACTGHSGNAEIDRRVRYFSTYNLDQRVLSDMGVIESNSTLAFLDEYYKDFPLDNSFEGQIARVSGMTKEEVSDTLALIDYYKYVAEYDPTERYAFGESQVKLDGRPMFDNENVLANDGIMLNVIMFADVRNRSFAV